MLKRNKHNCSKRRLTTEHEERHTQDGRGSTLYINSLPFTDAEKELFRVGFDCRAAALGPVERPEDMSEFGIAREESVAAGHDC